MVEESPLNDLACITIERIVRFAKIFPMSLTWVRFSVIKSIRDNLNLYSILLIGYSFPLHGRAPARPIYFTILSPISSPVSTPIREAGSLRPSTG